MTDTIKLTTVTAAIAAATITVTNAYGSSVSVNVKDMSAIPVAVNQQDCPLLAPRPNGFLSDFTFTRDTYGADAASKTVAYTLNYRFYYAPALQGTSVLEKYDEFATAAAAVLLYFATNTNISGTTEFLPQAVASFGPVADGAGTVFHGFDLALRVTQYMET